jgi:hypothetical protein
MPSDGDLQQTTARARGSRAALDQCRIALARGPLIRDGNHWRFGRRRFSNMTVKRLIEEGAAVRDGGSVISKVAADRALHFKTES